MVRISLGIIGILMLISWIDIVMSPALRVRTYNRIIWWLITWVPLVGPLLWFILGRPRAMTTPVTNPDDDNDYLSFLDEKNKKKGSQDS